MPFKNLKSRAMDEAMKFMQSEKGQKIMSNPDVQKAMAWAFQTSFKVKNNVTTVKKSLAKKLAVATEDDLKDLKRTIDRLERRVKKMNNDSQAAGAAPKATAAKSDSKRTATKGTTAKKSGGKKPESTVNGAS